MLVSKSKKPNTSTNSKLLEKIYSKLIEIENGDWFILNERDIDELFESVMEYTGAYNKETNKFLDGKNWSDLAHKMMNIFWKWYIKQIKNKLKITKYYEKYYNLSDKNEKYRNRN